MKKIEYLEAQIFEKNTELGKPEICTNGKASRKVSLEIKELEREIEKATKEWEKMSEG